MEAVAATATMDDTQIEVKRSFRDLRPAHYVMKISHFLELSELFTTMSGTDKYESGDFEVDGYKWRLCLYPNGDKKRNGSGHISLYLILVGPPNALSLSSKVYVFLQFFVYDQIRDRYLTVKDAKDNVVCFHARNTECGFPRLLPLDTFKDAAKGFLVYDCCTFGVEVFILNKTGRGETISIMNEPLGKGNSFSWKVDNFSTIEEVVYSEKFNVGGYEWKLSVGPNKDFGGRPLTSLGRKLSVGPNKGSGGTGNVESLSLHLCILDEAVLCSGQTVYASFKLRVKNHFHANHEELTVDAQFSASRDTWGFPSFMVLSKLKNPDSGFIVNDCLIVEQEFTCLSVREVSV